MRVTTLSNLTPQEMLKVDCPNRQQARPKQGSFGQRSTNTLGWKGRYKIYIPIWRNRAKS